MAASDRPPFAKRVFRRWLRIALVFEIGVAAIMAYVAFSRGVVAYQDGQIIRDFVLYSALLLGAAAIVAVAEVLSEPKQ